MRKILLSLVVIGLGSVPAWACFSPEMGSYYFWKELSEEMLGKEFVAQIRVISFEPTIWEPVDFELADGTARPGRKLIRWPRIEFEVVEVIQGELDIATSSQELAVDSCNSGMNLLPGDEYFVAGFVAEGRPMLQTIPFHRGGKL